MLDANQLHLVKLVQAVESPHVLSVAPRLPTEAGGVGAHTDRQALLLDDLVAEDIGHRYLRRRDEVKVIHLAVVHLSLLVRDLPGTEAGCLIDDKGRLDLEVARLASAVHEEADQRPL